MSAGRPPVAGPVYRVYWVPGTDELRATCHCQAVRTFDDPIELWTWLLDHPIGHRPGDEDPDPAQGGIDDLVVTGAAR